MNKLLNGKNRRLKGWLYPIFVLLITISSCSERQENTEETSPSASGLKSPSEELMDMNIENHDKIMDEMFGTPQKDIKTLGILIYEGVNDLDFTGPRYVLGQLMGVKAQLIAMKPGNIKTAMGTEIIPDTFIDSVQQLDILVIPGGFQTTIEGLYDEKLHEWIRMIDKNSQYTASVCTGGWILASTGLLEGKNVTTNWYRGEEMMARYGAVFQNKRYVNDGKYWTSAGVTAGVDMSLAIINDIWGEKYTQAIMLDMEYDPTPPIEGGTPQKTLPDVYQMMLAMYDMGAQPLMDSLEENENLKILPSSTK